MQVGCCSYMYGGAGLPLSDERSFDELDERLIPYLGAIPYDAEHPKW